MIDALNKLCKWRSFFAGWHLGTRPSADAGTKAMRDLMDKWIILRAEGNAMASLLLDKGVFTRAEYGEWVHSAAADLDAVFEQSYPGFRTSELGLVIYDVDRANQTMARMGFPP